MMSSAAAISAGLNRPQRSPNQHEAWYWREYGKSPYPDEIWMVMKPDPHGGWGGPPYPQECSPETPGAVRYCRMPD